MQDYANLCICSVSPEVGLIKYGLCTIQLGREARLNAPTNVRYIIVICISYMQWRLQVAPRISTGRPSNRTLDLHQHHGGGVIGR